MTEEIKKESLVTPAVVDSLTPKVIQKKVWNFTKDDLSQFAKPNCRKCSGRGYIGHFVNSNHIAICTCTTKTIAKKLKDENLEPNFTSKEKDYSMDTTKERKEAKKQKKLLLGKSLEKPTDKIKKRKAIKRDKFQKERTLNGLTNLNK